MMQRMGRFAGLAGATSLVAFSLGFAGPASATPSGAVPFSQANFSGYATGDELHLGLTALNALSGVTGSLNSLDQGLSSASTSSAGLTSDLKSELDTIIQPAQASAVKAFDLGAGLKVDLGTLTNTAGSLLSTVQKALPLPVTAIAPPNVPAATDQVGPVDVPPLLHAAALVGEAQAAWPGTACPTGNLSYGLGNLTAASVLTGLPTLTSTGVSTLPLISTAGTDNQQAVSQSKSLTTLVPNGDGSYGVQTQASDIIAPISINLLGLATLNIGVHAANGNLDPVTLTSTTSGEKSVPATLKMSTDDILTVVLTAAGQSTPVINESIPLSTIGQNGLHIPLTINNLLQSLSSISVPNALSQTLQNIVNGLPSQLQAPVQQVISALSPLLNQVTNVVGTVQNTVVNQPTVQQLLGLLQGTLNLNLGSIDVDTFPHAIGGAWNTAPTQSADGTRAAGALDLLNIKLGLTNSSINVGGQTIPAGTIPGVSQAISIPAITSLALPDIPLANPVVGHIETTATQQQPIACTTAAVSQQVSPTTPAAPPTTAPKLPFTGGPGGLWQPIAGVAFLGVGGGALALVRRLRRHSAV